jgi:hypothetical protein
MIDRRGNPDQGAVWRVSARVALLVCGLALGCASDGGTEPSTTDSTTQTVTQLPDVFKSFTSDVTVTLDGSNVVIRATSVPNHKSPYFASTDARYEAYNGPNPAFALNPNRIVAQNLVFRIPATPSVAATPQATPLGPIGVALNGVAIFNQYAANRQPLTGEINSFDQFNGHPQQSGQYHYHVEPLFLTQTRGKSGLVGFLLDGYPVYGPVENGKTLTSADLDELHGHTHATAEYPAGRYHYHVTADVPYINGSGFKGNPGTVGL